MSKYDNMYGNPSGMQMDIILDEGEQVLWRGKPDKTAYILNRSLAGLPFVAFWFIFDVCMIIMFAATALATFSSTPFWFLFVLLFFAIHMTPVWIWIINLFTSAGRWKNTEYVVTDRRIVLKSGFVGFNYQNIFYSQIQDMHMHVGIIDRICGVGDIIICNAAHSVHSSSSHGSSHGVEQSIIDIKDAPQVFQMLQKAARDLQSDTFYPNAMRPDVNPGYNTTYQPK